MTKEHPTDPLAEDQAIRPDARTDLVDTPESVGGWFARLFKGIMVGIGFILPGLSGGVLAVIFRIYDPMIRFLANPKHKFLKNVRYFIPVGIGGMIGVFLFSILVEAAFETYAAQFISLFIGFVIGTLPSLWRTAGKQGRSGKDVAVLVISAILIFALMLLGGRIDLEVAPTIPAWLMSGALIGLGVIVPGMSPSNFLIYFGLYDKMATGIKEGNLAVIIPLALGLVLCVLLFAKAANWAFDTYYSTMYHLILGLVVGSSLAIFPTEVFPDFATERLAEIGLSFSTAVLFAVAMLVVGIIASWLFSRVEDKVSDQREAIEARG